MLSNAPLILDQVYDSNKVQTIHPRYLYLFILNSTTVSHIINEWQYTSCDIYRHDVKFIYPVTDIAIQDVPVLAHCLLLLLLGHVCDDKINFTQQTLKLKSTSSVCCQFAGQALSSAPWCNVFVINKSAATMIVIFVIVFV